MDLLISEFTGRAKHLGLRRRQKTIARECLSENDFPSRAPGILVQRPDSWIQQLVEECKVPASRHTVYAHVIHFSPDAERFETLKARWQDETDMMSLESQKVTNMAYLQIIGMGKRALPYIFRQLVQRRRYWFVALEAITGENPGRDASSFNQAVDAWLEWANARSHLSDERTVRVSFVQ